MTGTALGRLKAALLDPHRGESKLNAALDENARPVPVIWLLGKTQAGKSSIVSALTGHPHAQVGNGFEPCTRTAQVFDFPPGLPVLKFLDTRGLGEVAYDPGEDIDACAAQSHLVMAVIKVADPRPEPVFEVLREVRRRHRDWPIVVAQTGLHDLYPPGGDHITPYPFGAPDQPAGDDYADLRRALVAQRGLLSGLPGPAPLWVPVDLTQPADGFDDPNYGLEALWDAIETVLPESLLAALRADEGGGDAYAHAADAQIVGHALAAAGLGALPVVDLFAVSAMQSKLLHALARMSGQSFDARSVGEFVGMLGGGVATGWLLGQAGRAVVKLVPGWGQTLGAVWGATQAGATTYALGKVAARYFEYRRRGQDPHAETLRQLYAEELEAGRRLLRERLRG